MTAQMSDKFFYNDEEFEITGIKSEGEGFVFDFFSPLKYGFEPVPGSTACWRGYLVNYMIKNNRFILDRLDINLDHYRNGEKISGPDPVPDIEGRKAHRIGDIITKTEILEDGTIKKYDVELTYGFQYIYAEMDLLIPFTGGLQIAQDFVSEFYVHMGFHPGWKYKKVLELIVENGIVVKINDQSKDMRQIRQEMRAKGEKIRLKNPEKYKAGDWIDDSFTLDY